MNASVDELPTPEQLNELLQTAEVLAKLAMENIGRIPPTSLFAIQGALLMHEIAGFKDDEEKARFIENLKLVCIAFSPIAVVTIIETWQKIQKKGETYAQVAPLHENIDREEMIVLSVESRKGEIVKFLPIIRTDNGKFFGFGNPGFLENVSSRFARLLPSIISSPEDSRLAQECLAARGVDVQQLS